MYVPMIGLAIMVAWGGADLLRRWPRFRRAWRPRLASRARARLGRRPATGGIAERCSRTPWKSPSGNYIAEHNLGTYLMEQPGQLDEAVAHLRAAARLRPESGPAHSDLGSALAKMPGRLPEAIAELQMAVRLLPDSAIPRGNLARALAEAAQMHHQSGLALAHAGQAREAAAEFEEAVRLQPDYAAAHNNLGVVLSQIPGKQSEAIAHFREALRLRPDYEDARYNLNLALESQRAGR